MAWIPQLPRTFPFSRKILWRYFGEAQNKGREASPCGVRRDSYNLNMRFAIFQVLVRSCLAVLLSAAFFTITLSAQESAAPEFRTWKNNSGKEMEAALLSVTGEVGRFRKQDGSEFDYPLANLSPEDRKTAADAAAKMPAANPAAKLSFLGVPISGKRIVVCMDVSLSFRRRLAGKDLVALAAELRRFAAAVPDVVSLNVILFHANADKFRADAGPLNATSRAELENFIAPFLEPGTNENSQTRSTRFGKDGKDSAGTAYLPLMVEDFPQTNQTSGGSRSDLAILAALSEKPDAILLLSEEFPEVKMQGSDKPVGNPKVIAYLQEAHRKAIEGGKKCILTVFSPPPPKERKTMTAGQKEAPSLYRRLAEMTGGKLATISADAK